MGPGAGAFLGRNVLITGHTGFKGSWLALWLSRAGATVSGLALDPPTTPSLFELADVGANLSHDLRVDIRDRAATQDAIARVAPEVVFHLAAQPLVRDSYANPIETFATNIMGTAHVIDAAARAGTRALICVTTDKVYQNKEWVHPYREVDPLGGHDPYSASKAAAELVAASLKNALQDGLRLATARAGNVIGGGDFAADRLVPDCVRAFSANEAVAVRNPAAVRPWQHVLDPLAGYLALAARLLSGEPAPDALNFGPDADSDATVGAVARAIASAWGGNARVIDHPDPSAPKEAGTLRLDSTKARCDIGWRPVWGFEEAIGRTVEWYRAHQDGADMGALTRAQIEAFESATTHD